MARARARLHAAVRAFLTGRGFEEVETPCLVPAPGMEPHIDAFAAPFLPEGGGSAQTTLAAHQPRVRDEATRRRGVSPRLPARARLPERGGRCDPQPRVHDAGA